MRPRTLANLTSWAPERLEALRRTLKGECDGLSGDLTPTCGPMFAVLFVLKQRAERLGLPRVLGTERPAKLALCLVLVRIAAQGSRLSAVRGAANHAVAETLGLGRLDAEDLSAALEALAPRQQQSEDTLYRVARRQREASPTVVLYDVPSSSCEGECHALAPLGYHREKKPGTAQIVMGLVTTSPGEPFAVHVCDGNPSDPLTVPAHGETLRTRLGITEGVCVGERGMVKRKGKTARAAAGSQSITALTTPQGRQLLREGVVRPEWLTPHRHEGPPGPVRLVRRRSEAVRRQAHRRRHDTLVTRPAWMTARQAFGRTAKRAQPAAGRRPLQAWITRQQLAGWVQGS